MKSIFLVTVVLLAAWRCVPERRVMGVYGTAYEDTIRLVYDHSWKVELAEPDTVDHKQFKYTTGRWHKKRNRIFLNVDSKSYGPYWECLPLKVSWSKLRRNIECDGKGKNYVFKKVNYRKLRRVARKEAKKEIRRQKEKEEEKMKRRMEELEASD
jgi:hypothetical protein